MFSWKDRRNKSTAKGMEHRRLFTCLDSVGWYAASVCFEPSLRSGYLGRQDPGCSVLAA